MASDRCAGTRHLGDREIGDAFAGEPSDLPTGHSISGEIDVGRDRSDSCVRYGEKCDGPFSGFRLSIIADRGAGRSAKVAEMQSQVRVNGRQGHALPRQL